MFSTATTQVFVNQDPKFTPPPQGPSSTRFVCLSDTHSHTFDIPQGDVLLHAGDLSSWGKVSELKKTIDWLASLSHPIKIIIAGNHDHCLDNSFATIIGFNKQAIKAAQDLVRGPTARKAGIYYLEHEAVEITTSQGHRWKVYGSPAAPLHRVEGSFQYQTSTEAQELYGRIPVDTDILLTHTPPYGVHDLTRRGVHAGCKILAGRLEQLERDAAKPDTLHLLKRSETQGNVRPSSWKCRLHVWGHIHEAYGASIKSESGVEHVQANAALPWYGTPIVVDLHGERVEE